MASASVSAKHLSGSQMSTVFKSIMDSQSEYPKIRDLTPRQVEIMQAFLSPLADNETVRSDLNISQNTLNTHLKVIFNKLGVDTLRKAIWRFVIIYSEYLPKFQVFYVAPAAEIVQAA